MHVSIQRFLNVFGVWRGRLGGCSTYFAVSKQHDCLPATIIDRPLHLPLARHQGPIRLLWQLLVSTESLHCSFLVDGADRMDARIIGTIIVATRHRVDPY